MDEPNTIEQYEFYYNTPQTYQYILHYKKILSHGCEESSEYTNYKVINYQCFIGL